MEKRHPKKGYRSVHARQHQTIALIEQLASEQNSIIQLCKLFEVPRSSYHYHLKNREKVDPERENLREKAVQIHKNSRGAAGARTIAGQLNQDGENIGRYKAASLMAEQVLLVNSRQSRSISSLGKNQLLRLISLNVTSIRVNQMKSGAVM